MSKNTMLVVGTLVLAHFAGCPPTWQEPGGASAPTETIAGTWSGTMHYKTAQWLSVVSTAVEGRSEVYPDILESSMEFEYSSTLAFGADSLPIGGLMILGGAATGPGATAAIYQPGQSHTFHYSAETDIIQSEVTYGATVHEATYSPTGSHVVIDLTQDTSLMWVGNPLWDGLWRKEALTGTQTIDVVLSGDNLTYTSKTVLHGTRTSNWPGHSPPPGKFGVDYFGQKYEPQAGFDGNLRQEMEYTGTLQRQ